MLAPTLSITPTPTLPLVLVLDIGSSSTRAALYDATATLVAGTMIRAKSSFRTADDGTAEDDPPALLERVATCIDGALAAAGPLAAYIAGVGCDTYVSNLLGLDADDQPCTPIYTYADTRPTAAAVALRARLDENAVRDRTGCPLRTSYAPALLTWLAADQPARFRAARRWISIGEWLCAQWFGRGAITFSAAAWTGLLNRRTLVWDADLLHEIGLRADQLGALTDVDQPFTGLREPWRTRWPALADIPWFGAIGDGAAANIGCGASEPDQIALSVGTTGALRAVLHENPDVPHGLWCYRVDRRLALLGGATSEGGNVLDWARRVLQIDVAQLDRFLLDSRAASQTLTVLPFIAGERSPGWGGDADMTITGINVHTSALDVARAALEGVTYRWAQIAALLRRSITGTPTVIASGGGLKYVPGWAQMIADVLDLPVVLSAEAETTSRGVALLALRSLGVITGLHDLPASMGPRLEPDHGRFVQHQAAIERQQRLYARLKP